MKDTDKTRDQLINELVKFRQRVEDLETSEKERRRAEEALRESEERFRQMYDEAPVGYHELDPEGRITRVNRRELEMLGYTEGQLLGRPVWKFVVEEEITRQVILAKIKGDVSFHETFERTYR